MRSRRMFARRSLSISLREETGIFRHRAPFLARAAITYTMPPRMDSLFPMHVPSGASFMTTRDRLCCNTRFDFPPDFRKRPFSTFPVVRIRNTDRLFKSAFSKVRIDENLSRSDVPTERQAVERIRLPHREGT